MWWESTRTAVNACPLNVSIRPVDIIFKNIPETRVQTRDGRKKDDKGQPITKKGDKQPNIIGGYVQWLPVQLADLKNTEKLLPDYKQLNSQVLQDVVNRVETSFSNFICPNKKGARSGRPKFKGFHYYKSFTYPQLDNSDITKDSQSSFCINLAKIGLVPFVFHRPLPDGFKVKTGSAIREADGWYICLTLEDKSVPVTVVETQPTESNSLGMDLGISNYLYLSNGNRVENPKVLRTSERRLAKLQRKCQKSKKGSHIHKAYKNKIARLHQVIARTRLDFQFKTAYWVFSQCDVLFMEDLSLKNLSRRCKPKLDDNGTFLPNGQSRKSGLNKSLLDAAPGQFAQVLKYIAWKLGKRVILVDPKGTSQHCWKCCARVSKDLRDRWHSCACGEELDRDDNSVKLIKVIGLVPNSGEGTGSLKNAEA